MSFWAKKAVDGEHKRGELAAALKTSIEILGLLALLMFL